MPKMRAIPHGASQTGACRRGAVGGTIVRWLVVGVVFSGVEPPLVQGQLGHGGVVDVLAADWVGARNLSLDIFEPAPLKKNGTTWLVWLVEYHSWVGAVPLVPVCGFKRQSHPRRRGSRSRGQRSR